MERRIELERDRKKKKKGGGGGGGGGGVQERNERDIRWGNSTGRNRATKSKWRNLVAVDRKRMRERV